MTILHRRTLTALALLLSTTLASSARAHTACDSRKVQCISGKVTCLLRLQKEAVRTAGLADPQQVTKCEERFAYCLARILNGAAPMCTVPNSTGELQASIDLFVDRIRGQVAGAKLVFVTSSLFTADFGAAHGAVDGDALCQQHAVAANLGGQWKAWLSDSSTSPSTRFARWNGPYELVDGMIVASNWTALTTRPLQHPISTDEYGAPAPFSENIIFESIGNTCGVWTGTQEDGTPFMGPPCNDWSFSGEGDGTTRIWNLLGCDIHDFTMSWTGNSVYESFACRGRAPLYCFEQ